MPNKKRTKYEPSSIKGIFVDYNETSKAYSIYILAQQKTVVTQDIEFVEEGWSSESHKSPTELEEGEKLVVPQADQNEDETSYSDQQGSSEITDDSIPSNSIRKPKWLT